jgi:hypothetical protein
LDDGAAKVLPGRTVCAARARLNYEAVKHRLIGEVPREVDKFLLAYYHTELEVHDRLLPFLQIISDTAMIHFLMMTAPSGFPKT